MIIKKGKFSTRVSNQRGIAVVECVIALPLVLFMILAVAEMGNAILQYNTLTQAVRGGARYFSDEAAGEDGVINVNATTLANTANIVVYGAITAGTPVLPGFSESNVTAATISSFEVSVLAQYDYQPIFFSGIPDLVGSGTAGGAFTMNAEVVMRIL